MAVLHAAVPRKVLQSLALSVASLAAVVLVCELMLRVYDFGWTSLWPPTMESIRPIGTSGLIRQSPILEIGYELRPNLHARLAKARFETNSRGLRDREYTLEKPPGTVRVAVIGDSFTMPLGVEIDDAYHSLLEEWTNRRPGGPTYEFINFGVAGYELPQYIAIIEHRALAYHPDLILVGFSNNDYIYFPDLAKQFMKPYEVKPTTHPFFELHVIPWAAARLPEVLHPGRFAPPEVDPPLHPIFRGHLESSLATLGEISRREGIPILVAFLVHYRRGLSNVIAALEELTARNGLGFVDASAGFPRDPELRYMLYRADAHPNAAAHHRFAETIFQCMVAGPCGLPAPRP